MSDFPVFVLRNASGGELTVTSYGCTVLSLKVRDRRGEWGDVVLGFAELERYPRESPHFGCVVGRFGNRIARGRFSLDGRDYQLECNNFPGGVGCHLHGGVRGFDKRVWEAERVQGPYGSGVRFSRVSADGEEGYPGEVQLEVTYWWSDADEFRIEYVARADRATPLNLTHHSYFNLRGEGEGDVLDHVVRIASERMVAVGADLIPTGELRAVAGGPLDFREAQRIGERIEAADEQLQFARGYDHCWVLQEKAGPLLCAADVYEPTSGRTLEVWTTEPGVQFYTGNFLDGTLRGKSGRAYPFRGGFCLEPQHFPDSPNQPAFPSAVLRPGAEYRSTTVYRFGVREEASGEARPGGA
ncbi:MAG: Aldose 1-epimerase precursor [Verrucomicrobiota bacterium]